VTDAAKADWDARIHRRVHGRSGQSAGLPPPAGLVADAGRGQVTVRWDPVPGAVGYLVSRAAGPEGPFEVIDHQGLDVLAVPGPPYGDTTTGGSTDHWYTVCALADVDDPGPAADPVRPRAGTFTGGAVELDVDASRVAGPLPRPWRPMIGSEHLSLLLSTDRVGGRPIGAELAEALRTMHEEFGVQTVRAHAILCDDLGVYREVDGRPVHDFSGVDRVYDAVLEAGLRPVVELSFMPRDLASDPSRTVFEYGAIISPPKDWGRWRDLVADLTEHLVRRYGLAEVRDRWSFEAWNEANLEVFWSGTQAEYLRLYDESARAVRSVDPGLIVGGPASAAAEWIDPFLAHITASGAPADFVSTHTYGSPPIDVRPLLRRHERPDLRIWWTEWGPTPRHGHPIGDTVMAAAFLLTGMRAAAGSVDALSHWVASDHFEELGRPDRLRHGGFGLLTVGNLRKPRFWALSLLERLGDRELPVSMSGDGAGSTVQAWAARHGNGRVDVLVWNGTLDQGKIGQDDALGRTITLRVTGLPDHDHEVRHHRIDEQHSNVWNTWDELGGADRAWPRDEQEWARLRAANRLDELAPPQRLRPTGGTIELRFELPMPAVSHIELSAEHDGA
jgi:xylan 1,4-beta-xylosidase